MNHVQDLNVAYTKVIATLETQATEIAKLRAELNALKASASQTVPATGSKLIQGPLQPGHKWDDPVVKYDPTFWQGPSGIGQHMSQLTPEYLDAQAKKLIWSANKSDEKGETFVNGKGETVNKSTYARKDAERAQYWAAYIRAKGNPDISGGNGLSQYDDTFPARDTFADL